MVVVVLVVVVCGKLQDTVLVAQHVEDPTECTQIVGQLWHKNFDKEIPTFFLRPSNGELTTERIL